MIELEAKDFKSVTVSEKLSIVDFWASWCGPCKMLIPVLEEISAEIGNKATLYKMNVDIPEKKEIAKSFDVKGIPTVIFFKNGVEIDRSIGYIPKEEMLEIIAKHS